MNKHINGTVKQAASLENTAEISLEMEGKIWRKEKGYQVPVKWVLYGLPLADIY